MDSYKLPNKLLGLMEGEFTLRTQGVKAIGSKEALQKHINVIESSMDVLFHCAQIDINNDEDLEVIRLLGMRLFNGCAASMNLILSGYYQNAAMVMRDLLETVFLLGYFQRFPKKISKWRASTDAERKKHFSAINIRIALDDKDGFTGKKRAEAYGLFCELASHPTYKGFRMLAPKGHPHHCGPFFDISTFEPMIEELAKLGIQAGQVHSRFFSPKNKEGFEIKINFLEVSSKWIEECFGRPLPKGEIEELKKLMKEL